MIEFILGSLFGFGSFVLFVYLTNFLLVDNAQSMSRILDSKYKERFGADKDKK